MVTVVIEIYIQNNRYIIIYPRYIMCVLSHGKKLQSVTLRFDKHTVGPVVCLQQTMFYRIIITIMFIENREAEASVCSSVLNLPCNGYLLVIRNLWEPCTPGALLSYQSVCLYIYHLNACLPVFLSVCYYLFFSNSLWVSSPLPPPQIPI